MPKEKDYDLAAKLSGQVLSPEDPGYVYGSLLPYRYKRAGNSDTRRKGTPVELAMPGMARDALNSIGELLAAPREALLSHLQGKALDQAGINSALTLAGLGPAGTAPKGALRIMAGRNAESARHSALSKAMIMEMQHATSSPNFDKNAVREATRNATGWYRGADDHWKFEIPDMDAAIRKNKLNKSNTKAHSLPGDNHYYNIPFSMGGDMKLPELLDHPRLFKAYPHLADYTVHNMPILDALSGINGALDEAGKRIYLQGKPLSELKGVLHHEIQHAVQYHEGFATGGSSEEFLPSNYHEERAALDEKLAPFHAQMKLAGANPFTVFRGLQNMRNGEFAGYAAKDVIAAQDHGLDLNAFHDLMEQREIMGEIGRRAHTKYTSLGGEVEARVVQERAKDPKASLLPPWENKAWLDFPDQDQIIRGQQ